MFIRKRTINGHTYYSREERYWCPITKKVKSRYLGRVDWGYTLRGDGRQPSSEEVNAEIARKEQAERSAKEREFSQAKFLEATKERVDEEGTDGEQDAGEEAVPDDLS